MESPIVNLQRNANSTLDATLELPFLKLSARNKVDVYLPSTASNWRGPALQEQIQRVFPEDDIDVPPKGMLRPVDTSFSEPPKRQTTKPRSPLISSYARRSAKRGLLYTAIITVILAAIGTWSAMNFDTLQQAVLDRFN